MGYMDYSKFFELLAKRGHNRNWLRTHGISSRVIFQMDRYESITTNTICSLCELLNCQPKDIMEYKKGEPPKKEEK